MDINILPFLLFALSSFFIHSNTYFHAFYHTNSHQTQKKYQQWKHQFSMKFTQQQDKYRFQTFSLNLQKINSHNQLLAKTYDLGLNQFAHLTEKEFIDIILGQNTIYQYNLKQQPFIQSKDQFFINLTKLTDIDWQSLGKVSEVKNQGSCNAGYVFSTTGLIQTSLMMQNQNAVLSQQQIIDCATNYGIIGCQGGGRDGALKYSQQKGLVTQKQYPYTAAKGQCKIQKGTYFPDFTITQAFGCDQIRENLYKSPITVAVNSKNWQLYSTGVFNNCPSTGEPNHQALLVGVTISYWRLKNSWGTRWGQNGYIRIKLGDNCGICERVGYGFFI